MTQRQADDRAKPRTGVMLAFACVITIIGPGMVRAGETNVVRVEVTPQAGAYRFDVTLRHDDAGWDHYADKWQVLGPDGTVLGERILHHPHVDEQPFTRSLSGVTIPQGIAEVTIRGHDSVHGWGGAQMTVALPDRR